jgi:hypothetical protein
VGATGRNEAGNALRIEISGEWGGQLHDPFQKVDPFFWFIEGPKKIGPPAAPAAATFPPEGPPSLRSKEASLGRLRRRGHTERTFSSGKDRVEKKNYREMVKKQVHTMYV